MADKKRRHEAADPQQENPNDPIFVPDLSKIPGLAEKGKFERAVAGEMDFHDLYESICGVTDDSQDVEMYDGSLGVTQAFVTTHQRPVACCAGTATSPRYTATPATWRACAGAPAR